MAGDPFHLEPMEGRRHVVLCHVTRVGGCTHLLLALVIWPLTTHPFRGRAPFSLLIETPPAFGRSLRVFHMLHKNCLLILSPSCSALCGRDLSPRIAMVSLLLSSLPNTGV